MATILFISFIIYHRHGPESIIDSEKLNASLGKRECKILLEKLVLNVLTYIEEDPDCEGATI